MTSTEKRTQLINNLWQEIIDTWKAIELPEYIRGKLDNELGFYYNTNGNGRISLRALSRYNLMIPAKN
ncbi:MAG: hypothetical protein EHM28_11885 [Spirochaetaceae bacterium]|nr:MAG: hypothetical protein EHM28_11885 [Spirochaetaceae bacterium]